MIKKRELDVDVLTATKQRIISIFKSGNKIRMSFSGGKDSIVLADIIYNLCVTGQVDKSLLYVAFIDEEAMYDDVIDIVHLWRKKFMQIGVKFDWFCMQYKHFNCLNSLSDEETFICWEESKKECWVRQPPSFAIRSHPLLVEREDNYQSFLSKLDKQNGYLSITGIRIAESLQRQQNIARMKTNISGNSCFPIYDWTDKDIWLYIYKYNVKIPDAYENMYRIGVNKNKLRISQFFSIDTAKSLVGMNEMYPDLMERVIKREPNAYLCAMYWDTEMFGKSTKKRRELEKKENKKDYKKIVLGFMKNPPADFSKNQLQLINSFKRDFLLIDYNICDKNIFKDVYECIITGDPKQRKIRAITLSARKQITEVSKEQRNE